MPDDLLSDPDYTAGWWRLESDRVPDGDLPDIRALRRLRAVPRDAIEAVTDGLPVLDGSVADLNFFIQSAPFSTRLARTGAGLRTETRWHHEYGGSTGLAFIAAQAAESISDPVRASRLRRCAHPACRMIFAAVNPRRSWCVPEICGNRVRVARHHRRSAG